MSARATTDFLQPTYLIALSDDLPVRVFSDYLAVPELKKVATSNSELLACRARARQEPLGNTSITTCPVAVFTVMNVRDPAESSGQALADLVLANATCTPRFRSPRHVGGRVVRKEFHDPIEIVLVECVKQLLSDSTPT